MTIASDREDEVLLEFGNFLTKSSIEVTLLEQPDRLSPSERKFVDVTTDGLMKFSLTNADGSEDPSKVLLAGVDVMLLALDRENLSFNDLDESIGEIASELDVQIFLSPSPPIFRFECESIAQELRSAIEHNVSQGNYEFRAEVCFSWRKTPQGDEPSFEFGGTWMHTSSAKISDQIRNENVAPLTRKTKPGGQADRCQQSGIPYILVLDGVGTPEVVQGTHWLSAFPFTFQQGILEALGEREVLVDAIFMLGKNGEWSILKNDLSVFSNVPTGI